MKNKFKYWLTSFLLISVSRASATDRTVRSRAVRGMVVSGDMFWDQSASLAEFIYREKIRYSFKMAFDFMLTKGYVESSSKDKFVAEFKQVGEKYIRPYMLGYCSCCRMGNDLIYRHTSAAILNLALKHRSLISTDTKIWYQHQQKRGDFFIPVAPIDDFVFESERVVDKVPSKLYTVATKIQTAFRDHRVGLHERVYEARVAKVIDNSRKDAAATRIQAVARGCKVRRQQAARVVRVDDAESTASDAL